MASVVTSVARRTAGATPPPSALKCPRRFVVGTTGWSADDLDDPRIERLWERGRFEIVEGVLARMPPAYYEGALPLGRLLRTVQLHLHRERIPGDLAPEVDFIVNRKRVARPDLIFVTPEDHERQTRVHRAQGTPRPNVRFGRLRVPPTLVLESVSLGHEEHDRETKRRWYAEAGVRHYWLLDPYRRTFDALVLAGAEYKIDQAGRESDEVRPSLFPGLVIPLATLWP